MGGIGGRAKIEHSAPQRGRGAYGTKFWAKRLSDKARRSPARREIADEVADSPEARTSAVMSVQRRDADLSTTPPEGILSEAKHGC